jgi:hypothetical protein
VIVVVALGEPGVPLTCYAVTWLTKASELAKQRSVVVMDRHEKGLDCMFVLPDHSS